MKLWAMPYKATQEEWVMMESADKTWATAEGKGKPLQYSCLEYPINSMKKQKDMTSKDELPRLIDVWRIGEGGEQKEWRDGAKVKKPQQQKQTNKHTKKKKKKTPTRGYDWWWK